MATTLTPDPSTNTDRSGGNDLIFAVAGIHLLLAIATDAAAAANIDTGRLAGFSWWSGAPLFVPLALSPVIAYVARTRQPWVSLASAIVLAFVGSILAITANVSWAWITGAVMFEVAALTAAAVLLVTAWRSSPSVTAVLAGVFVVSETVASAILVEYFAQLFSGTVDVDRGFVGLEYMAVGSVVVAALLLFLARTTDGTPQHEHGLLAIHRLAAVLAIGGIAFALTHRLAGDDGWVVAFGGVAFVVGLTVVLEARRDRWPDPTPVHLDARIVMLCGAAIACMALIDLADLAPLAPNFGDADVGLRRALDVMAVVLIVPAVVLAARSSKIVLSSAALLGALYGGVRLISLLGDEPLGQRWLLGGQFIAELALAILLGGTVALALRRTDHGSIEVGVIVFLVGPVLVRAITNEVGLRYIGDTRLSVPDLQPFQILTIAGAVGFAALAIWWAGTKPSTSAPAIIEE